MSYNSDVVNKGVKVTVTNPPQKPQTNVVVVERPCMENCCPKLSSGCDLCTRCCGDYYIEPMCNYVGITGLLYPDQCITFDERYGGCGECIGCDVDCPPVGYCPFYSTWG